DRNGNLSSDGLTSYTWNARDQLTNLTGGTGASFAYDGFGRRLGKTVAGVSTNFLYDGINVAQELSAGAPTANVLSGDGIDEAISFSDPLGLSPGAGGPLHPPVGLAFSCKDGDPCPMLIAKMGVYEALIVGHLAYDRTTGQVGRHRKEIDDFRRGLANCKKIY